MDSAIEPRPPAKMQKYIRLARLELAETLAMLKLAFENKHRRSLVAGFSVNTHSMRLRTFACKGTSCIQCGLPATHFALEHGVTEESGSRPHLNLWGVEGSGEAVLFTQDHTVARANGGPDTLENSQTMCGPCNWEKRDS